MPLGEIPSQNPQPITSDTEYIPDNSQPVDPFVLDNTFIGINYDLPGRDEVQQSLTDARSNLSSLHEMHLRGVEVDLDGAKLAVARVEHELADIGREENGERHTSHAFDDDLMT